MIASSTNNTTNTAAVVLQQSTEKISAQQCREDRVKKNIVYVLFFRGVLKYKMYFIEVVV